MVLFLNLDKQLKDIIPLDQLASVKVYSITMENKALNGPEVLDSIISIVDAFSYETDTALIAINGLDIALDNLKETSDDLMIKQRRNLFKGLLNQFVSVGHEIVFYLEEGKVDPEILEFDEMDGCDIIRNEDKLYEHMKTHIM